MMVHIPQVLTPDQVARCRDVMEKADWVDGRVTAGHQSERVKNNLQLPENTPEARELGIGDVSDTRLKSAIATIAASFELPRLPNPGDIFDHAFLPAKADRIPPGIAP